MKVLWLCNIVFPQVAPKLGIRNEIGGGWMLGLLNAILTNTDCKLSVLSVSSDISDTQRLNIDGVEYYVVPASKHIDTLVEMMTRIIEPGQFDVIHIFGSEYLTSYAMACTLSKLNIADRALLHIQGLVSVYAKHYAQGIPGFWVYLKTPRDIIKDMSICHQRNDFIKRGRYEEKTLQLMQHIGGRTLWDKACAYHINPQAQYHHNGEILRESFYHAQWSLDDCERNSIFISQGNYPIKGLHHVLKALPYIIRHFPDVKVYVAGFSPLKCKKNIRSFLKRNSYGHYLIHLIKKHDLEQYIVFTGPLKEKEMLERYKKSHVFVSASSIENSPNSLGEAMILGMPCVSSDVGGVSDMLVHKEEGFLYPVDAEYMLAYCIMQLFSDDQLSVKFGLKARKHAMFTHDVIKTVSEIRMTYQKMKDD